MSISRRSFLEATALAPFAAKALAGTTIDNKTGMPMRVLGKTGVKHPVMAGRGLGLPQGFQQLAHVVLELGNIRKCVDVVGGKVVLVPAASIERLG